MWPGIIPTTLFCMEGGGGANTKSHKILHKIVGSHLKIVFIIILCVSTQKSLVVIRSFSWSLMCTFRQDQIYNT
jgi:Mn2+/Fe2+ NRAMP family transporter